jgi:hypothetical protein
MDSAGLIALQNADGGWGFRGGGSWTEPTCYALLALAAAGLSQSQEGVRGAAWLASRQRADGGWGPRDGVERSTWVSALALLLPESAVARPRQTRAAAWVAAQTGRESSFVYRLRMQLLGVRQDGPVFDGWPWYPETAAWVAPTALSILAMKKFASATGQAEWGARIEQGRQYLLARRCRDGGWNHGSTRALGYDSDSYPETTGIALLALHDSTAGELGKAEEIALRHLASCRSCEGASWLRLALLARGRAVPGDIPRGHGGTVEIALAQLAEAAGEGRNLFLA